MTPQPSLPRLALALMIAAGLALSACGSEDEATSTATTDTSTSTTDTSTDDEDHDEEDHDDEDHDDEDHDTSTSDDEDHDDDESTSGLGAHEHGVGQLTIAWSESDVIIDLVSPTQNIFGFEYEAVSDEDLAVVTERTEALSAPDILTINAEAGCTQVGDVVTELEYEGSHAELTASWLLSCESPDEIKQLDAAALFSEFPNLEDIDAEWASPTGQSAAELTPSATVLSLE